MSKSTIEKLKRRYVAEDLDLSEWENLEDELKKLEKFEIVDGDSLEVFLHYWSELFMILQEQLAWKYIDMTRFADNEDKRLEYSRFYAEVYSKSEPYKIKLMNKYHSSRFRKDLDSHRYENFDAIVSNTVELFREENLSLEIEEKKLASEYAAIIGSLTVDYRDHEYTLSQLSKFQLEPDRSVREEAWLLSMRKLKEVHMNLEELFDSLAAGFLSSYFFDGYSIRESVLRGQIAARYCCSKKGVSSELITKDHLDLLFEEKSEASGQLP